MLIKDKPWAHYFYCATLAGSLLLFRNSPSPAAGLLGAIHMRVSCPVDLEKVLVNISHPRVTWRLSTHRRARQYCVIKEKGARRVERDVYPDPLLTKRASALSYSSRLYYVVMNE